MSNSFTTLWNRDRVIAAQRIGGAAFRFQWLFGGPHISLPSFRRAGVSAGDWVYPIHVHRGALHILGRMRIERIVELDDFPDEYPEVAREVRDFDRVTFFPKPDASGLKGQLSFLAPTCTEHVLVGSEGTPFWADLVVPPESVSEIRYTSKKRPVRPIKHLDAEGRITAIVSIQGIYRLSAESAETFELIVKKRLARGTGAGVSAEFVAVTNGPDKSRAPSASTRRRQRSSKG